MQDNDTIVAISTASGYGGIGIVRISGSMAKDIALTMSHRNNLKPRYAHFSAFFAEDGKVIDEGLVLWFPAPSSFTGENTVEIQGHGGPIVLNRILKRCLQMGARQAHAGEFSKRAFINDKLDLVQAEAISDLINAQTETAARHAQASLSGEFSNLVGDIRQQLVQLQVFVEAAIDFPEEEIDFISDGNIVERLKTLRQRLEKLLKNAKQGAIVRSGATVVLSGKPNTGKSSLLNAFAGEQIAIVADIPGTTRDVIREYIELDGVPLKITDTAGLRDSEDKIEQEGVRRAYSAMSQADLTLQIIDDTDVYTPVQLQVTSPLIRVFNKIDLSCRAPGAFIENVDCDTLVSSVAISTKTGDGLPDLRTSILDLIGIDTTDSSHTLFSARERHLQVLKDCLTTLSIGEQQFLASGAGELLAEDLRQAHKQLGEITGDMTSDQLLGEIFSTFCIGK